MEKHSFEVPSINSPEGGQGDFVEPTVRDELLHEISEQLAIIDNADRETLHARLRQIGLDYLGEKEFAAFLGEPQLQKAAIRRLGRSLDAALDAIDDISPEFWVSVQMLACKKTSQPVSSDPRETIEHLREAVAEFLANYEPSKGPRTNIALEGGG